MGSDGVEPPETEATSFMPYPRFELGIYKFEILDYLFTIKSPIKTRLARYPYGITPQILNEINFIKHWGITLNMIMS